MRRLPRAAALVLGMAVAALVPAPPAAAEDLDLGAPGVVRLKAAMADRHGQLKPLYESGAVGLARDGSVVLRDAGILPLSQRQAAGALVAAENADRTALYREIARANGNPAWEQDIRITFGQRWIDRAPAGWWVQAATGAWVRKP